jgi:hypothetical protein
MAMWTLPTAVSTWLGSTAIKSARADLSKLPALSADGASWRGIDETAFGRSFCLIPHCGIEVWLTSVRGLDQ